MALTQSDIALDLAGYQPPLDPRTLFPSPDQPVHLEIGSGKGTFLVNEAKAHPEYNFLGIEWANQIYRYALDRLRRWQLSNTRLCRTDARDFIAHYLPDASIAAVHVYFPDPWPKKRHHKRRFFALDNLLHVHRILVPGGRLYTVTDHPDYARITAELLLENPQMSEKFRKIDFFPPDSASPGEFVGTNFERKYRREGRSFHPLALEKR